MQQTSQLIDLHQQAALKHEAAAQLHREAALCQTQNRIQAAQTNSVRALVLGKTACTISSQVCDKSLRQTNENSLFHTEPHTTHRQVAGTLRLKSR